jgi:hypothetical protein
MFIIDMILGNYLAASNPRMWQRCNAAVHEKKECILFEFAYIILNPLTSKLPWAAPTEQMEFEKFVAKGSGMKRQARCNHWPFNRNGVF